MHHIINYATTFPHSSRSVPATTSYPLVFANLCKRTFVHLGGNSFAIYGAYGTIITSQLTQPSKRLCSFGLLLSFPCAVFPALTSFLGFHQPSCGIKTQPRGNYNADLDRLPTREIDRRNYSVAVSTGVGRARQVELLTVPRRVGLVTYLG